MTRSRFVLVAVALAGLALPACGSDTGEGAASTTRPPAESTTKPPDEATTADSPSDTSTTSIAQAVSAPLDLPDLVDATYSTGRIHLEMSGDASDAFESDGSGATTGGVTSAAFAGNEGRLVSLGFGGDTGAAMAVSVSGLSTTVEFGKDCDLTFTQHDETRIAATFDCPTVQAVDNTTTIKSISLTGNFWLAP